MNKAAGWITGLLTLLALSALALRFYVPPLPGTLALGVEFASTPQSPTEPLFVTGRTDDGDFIFVKYLDATTVVFGYDRWGAGGPVSAPINVRPGTRHTLVIASPSAAQVRGSAVRGPERLRVTFDGAVVLDTAGRFELRRASRAWLAENPIGGSSCGPRFSGQLFWPDGRAVRGGVRQVFSFGDRLGGWLNFGRWQVLGLVLASVGAGWTAAWLARTRGVPLLEFIVAHRAGPHRWFITAAAPCVIAFSWLITDGTGQFVFPEQFGDFYDYQAASLLQGRLDVPEPAISGEAFVVGGRYYGYFGLTPALLRLPLVAYDLGWGCLSRGLMLGYYLACLVAAYALLCRAAQRLGGAAGQPSAWATVVFTLCVGLGSTLFFLGSRAYIYHEAILCGAMFALWSAWLALRWLDAPASRAWLGALMCGVLAVHARPPVGLFALALLGCVAITVALDERAYRRSLLVAALCALGVLSFTGLSYLKFRTFDGSPFKYSVQYDAKRRAQFGDANFHLVNLPFNTDVYLLRPNFQLQRGFPWLVVERQPRESRPSAKIDLIEHTLGFPYAMPALFALATLGSGLAAVRASALRRELAVLWLGLVPMAGALFCAVVTSHRYTADFCPFFIATAACGFAAVESLAARARTIVRTVLVVLVAASIFATGMVSLWFQGDIVWGVPAYVKKHYQEMQQRADAFFGVTHR